MIAIKYLFCARMNRSEDTYLTKKSSHRKILYLLKAVYVFVENLISFSPKEFKTLKSQLIVNGHNT